MITSFYFRLCYTCGDGAESIEGIWRESEYEARLDSWDQLDLLDGAVLLVSS